MPEPSRPAPAGIGNCSKCPYFATGTAAICFECARETVEALPPISRRCEVCDLPLQGSQTCGNPICSFDDRYFVWNYAIAMRSGVLEHAITRFKYEGAYGWRNIFARVLVGFLDVQRETFSQFDLIVPSPTFLAEGRRRSYDHTGQVISAADDEAEGRWPFDVDDPPTIIRTADVPPMVGHNWKQRREIAEGQLREALAVTDPGRTSGKKLLVYDDVFTDGFTLRETARCLELHGQATAVCGITLTRQPWKKA